MRSKIIYDDIIYSLQKSGGGSVYWTEVIRPSLEYAEHYIYDTAEENIFYEQIKSKMINKHILSSKNLLLKRFLNPIYNVHEAYIFHSSYFRYSRDKRAINVTTVHDFIVEKYGKNLHSKVHQIQQKNAVKHSDCVICVSENTKKDFLEFYPWFRGDITVIHNGYDTDAYFFENGIEKKKQILFVGGRSDYKHFDFAIRIVQALDDCSLLIVGGGELSKKEKRSLEELIPFRYTKKEFISNSELRHLYNGSFFLCYPSEYEGFGIPLLEAQACGCPVVCQKKSSIPEIANDSAVYIDVNDFNGTIQIVKQLYYENFYRQYQAKGWDNIKHYSWKKTSETHQYFYKRVWEKFAFQQKKV